MQDTVKSRLITFLSFIIMTIVACGCGEKEVDEPQPDINAEGEEPAPSESDPYDIKMLVVGNSFARNAVDNYLNCMLNEAGVKYKIARLHKSSASLKMHLDNLNSQADAYDLLIITNDGITHRENVSINECLDMDRWAIVSLQEVSTSSGNYDLIRESLEPVIAAITAKLGYKPRFIYHQTWAYASDFNHWWFEKYHYNQMEMYEKIVLTSKEAAKLTEKVVPCGTAIQNARRTSLNLFGDELTLDGVHLDPVHGSFIAAMTWYEALTGKDCRELKYRYAKITEQEKAIASEAVHSAILSPFSLTEITTQGK